MRLAICILLLAVCSSRAQNRLPLDSVGNTTTSDNLYVKRLAGDSLVSSFCILIKKEVKPHKHVYHSEHVLVLDGEGLMTLGDSTFTVRKNDLIFIPKNTVHSAVRRGIRPLKVLSIQAPEFDGRDRVFLDH
jgi:mannose-6-phosphate isomerase-like protein (cupin superfamily)